MSVTVQSLVDQVAYDLLENTVSGPGFTSGCVTQQEILDYLGITLMDFLRQTGLIWQVATQTVASGTAQYVVPDSLPEVYYVFQNACIVNKIDLFSNLVTGAWQAHPGQTLAYHEDGLPIKTLEMVPPPNWDGVAPTGTPFEPGKRDLTLVGSALASKEAWNIGDTLDTIPDTFTPYLVFGIEAKVFAKDGEAKDLQRASYCDTRYKEGIALGKSILLTMLDEAQRESQ